jgi:HK97 family phage portal protein
VGGKIAPRQDLIVHDRVNPIPGRVLGMSPIQEHATAIGTSLAASKFGSQFFRDGAHPSALLTNTDAIDAEQAAVAKSRWLANFNGSREPAVLGKGWDYKPISITPEESQFLQTQGFSEAQCARIFGPAMAEVLGYETGGSMTYANVVDRRADLLALTLDRWFNRIERLLSSLLPAPQYALIDRDALLRSATLARYEAHASALTNRWKTINEIRDDEDMAPVPWGDEPNTATNTAGTPAGGTDGNTAGI